MKYNYVIFLSIFTCYFFKKLLSYLDYIVTKWLERNYLINRPSRYYFWPGGTTKNSQETWCAVHLLHHIVFQQHSQSYEVDGSLPNL